MAVSLSLRPKEPFGDILKTRLVLGRAMAPLAKRDGTPAPQQQQEGGWDH